MVDESPSFMLDRIEALELRNEEMPTLPSLMDATNMSQGTIPSERSESESDTPLSHEVNNFSDLNQSFSDASPDALRRQMPSITHFDGGDSDDSDATTTDARSADHKATERSLLADLSNLTSPGLGRHATPPKSPAVSFDVGLPLSDLSNTFDNASDAKIGDLAKAPRTATGNVSLQIAGGNANLKLSGGRYHENATRDHARNHSPARDNARNHSPTRENATNPSVLTFANRPKAPTLASYRPNTTPFRGYQPSPLKEAHAPPSPNAPRSASPTQIQLSDATAQYHSDSSNTSVLAEFGEQLESLLVSHGGIDNVRSMLATEIEAQRLLHPTPGTNSRYAKLRSVAEKLEQTVEFDTGVIGESGAAENPVERSRPRFYARAVPSASARAFGSAPNGPGDGRGSPTENAHNTAQDTFLALSSRGVGPLGASRDAAAQAQSMSAQSGPREISTQMEPREISTQPGPSRDTLSAPLDASSSAERIAELEAEILTQRNTYAAKMADLERGLTRVLDEQERELERTRADLERMQRERDNSGNTDLVSQLQLLENRVSERDSQIEGLRGEVTELRGENENKQEIIAALDAELDEVYAALDNEREGIEAVRAEAQETAKKAQEEAQRAKEEAEQARDDAAEARQALADNATAATSPPRDAQVVAEFDAIADERDRYRQEAAALAAAKEELEERVASLREQVAVKLLSPGRVVPEGHPSPHDAHTPSKLSLSFLHHATPDVHMARSPGAFSAFATPDVGTNGGGDEQNTLTANDVQNAQNTPLAASLESAQHDIDALKAQLARVNAAVDDKITRLDAKTRECLALGDAAARYRARAAAAERDASEADALRAALADGADRAARQAAQHESLVSHVRNLEQNIRQFRTEAQQIEASSQSLRVRRQFEVEGLCMWAEYLQGVVARYGWYRESLVWGLYLGGDGRTQAQAQAGPPTPKTRLRRAFVAVLATVRLRRSAAEWQRLVALKEHVHAEVYPSLRGGRSWSPAFERSFV